LLKNGADISSNHLMRRRRRFGGKSIVGLLRTLRQTRRPLTLQ